ncbi:hypothetical protein RFI_08326, partial [Reticulomyxa filosa]
IKAALEGLNENDTTPKATGTTNGPETVENNQDKAMEVTSSTNDGNSGGDVLSSDPQACLSDDENKDWNQWIKKHSVDIPKLQYLPKKTVTIERELRATQEQLRQERQKTSEHMLQWKSRIEQQNSAVKNLHDRAKELETMLNQFSNENDELKQDIKKLQIENVKLKKADSAHQIFLQMKAEEEKKKTQELQTYILTLQTALSATQQREEELRLYAQSVEEKIEEERNEHQREMSMLKDKISSLTTLSQEEIQQAFQFLCLFVHVCNHRTKKKRNGMELEDMLNTTTNAKERRETNASSLPSRTLNSDPKNTPHNTNTTASNSNIHKISSHKLVQDLLQSLEEEKVHGRALEEELQTHRQQCRQKTQQKLDLLNELENRDIDHLLSQSQIFDETLARHPLPLPPVVRTKSSSHAFRRSNSRDRNASSYQARTPPPSKRGSNSLLSVTNERVRSQTPSLPFKRTDTGLSEPVSNPSNTKESKPMHSWTLLTTNPQNWFIDDCGDVIVLNKESIHTDNKAPLSSKSLPTDNSVSHKSASNILNKPNSHNSAALYQANSQSAKNGASKDSPPAKSHSDSTHSAKDVSVKSQEENNTSYFEKIEKSLIIKKKINSKTIQMFKFAKFFSATVDQKIYLIVKKLSYCTYKKKKKSERSLQVKTEI